MTNTILERKSLNRAFLMRISSTKEPRGLEPIDLMTIFVILRQNDYFETFALLFHQLF